MTVSPTIALILPPLAGADGLDRTLSSLAAQVGAFRLRCHVVLATTDANAAEEQLAWWQARTSRETAPATLRPLEISHQRTAAKRWFDDLEQGVKACYDADLLGWLMPGSTLAPDLLQRAAKAIEAFEPSQLSWMNSSAPGPMPTQALKAGLCDGTHWPALPAAGTFFRPWLWHKAHLDPAVQDQDPGTAAWALWRAFSQYASLIQLSAEDTYTEIDISDPLLPDPAALEAQLSKAERRAALAKLATTPPPGAPVWRELNNCNTQGELTIQEFSATAALLDRCHQVLDHPAPKRSDPCVAAPGRETARGVTRKPDSAKALIHFENNILSYDKDWQYPAITEQHAFLQLSRQGAVPAGVTYLAYPWATLIDKMHRKTADLQTHLAHFRAFCSQIPKDTIKVTVCQHIKMKDELELFRLAGVSEIFWSHTTHADLQNGRRRGLRLHPFPLFPVQAADADTVPAPSGERPHLFSFVGARANQHYLTGSRNWILDLLQDDPRGCITGRNSWHYNKVVYDHQIHAAGHHREQSKAFVDTSASEEFRTSLRASVFSLCPSGTGPNSIRLWESLGLGAVPVILADSWAPPGDPALWQAGAVFCEETPEAIRALPDRLAALVADEQAMERLRHGARQLWALYGPDSFIYDLQKFMLDAADRTISRPDMLEDLTEKLASDGTAKTSQSVAALYLSSLTSRLLLEGEAALQTHSEDARAQTAEIRARAALTDAHPLTAQLDQTQALLCRRSGRDPVSLHPTATAAPALVRRGPLRVCLMGKHSNRTPLAYAPFRKLARDRITVVDTLQDADILLTGFSTDLRELAPTLAAAQQQNPDLQLAVLSEEPLWDSIWNSDLVSRHQHLEAGGHRLDYHVFNHCNCAVFDFETIPYFLLTRTDFQARYELGLARHARLTPATLLQHWREAPVPAAFFAEVRDNPAYAKTWPEHQVEGLSVYRTDVARLTDLPGTLREGRGWRPGAKRQALADWHLDKLATLDMRTRVLAAYENTHQHTYISEKLFDAFLLGALPTYYAGPGHRVHELVPETAMINTYGLTATQAAEQITNAAPNRAWAEAWLDTAHQLHIRFSDLDAIARERRRVTCAVLEALESCLP